MKKYNRVIKLYPDGTEQIKLYETLQFYDLPQEDHEVKHDGSSVERKEKENRSRAVQRVYDYAKCNDFNWFVTLTVSADKCNRYDYGACKDVLGAYRKYLCRIGCSYIFVPEMHKDGAWHFHGLVSKELPVSPAYKKDGYMIHDVYWANNYDIGFSTATKINDSKRTATYIAKYLTKEMSVPKGCKRYWCSNGLKKPKEKRDYVQPDSMEFKKPILEARYYKRVVNQYGDVHICEK